MQKATHRPSNFNKKVLLHARLTPMLQHWNRGAVIDLKTSNTSLSDNRKHEGANKIETVALF